MDKISVDFVFEFAKDLKKIFETLQKEENLSNPFKSSELAELLNKKSSQLTEELYNKYKDHLDLKIRKIDEKLNLEFRNISNELILIPEFFINSINYKNIEENLDILLILMRNRNVSWEDFSFRLTQLFSYSKNKIKTINASTLEKIRFFMSFVNEYPDYITETSLPEKSKFKEYKSKYTKWGRTKTFYNVYNRFIANDTNFSNHHIRINPIPNYNAGISISYFVRVTK